MIFLQVLGAILLAIIILVLFGYLYIRIKIKRLINNVSDEEQQHEPLLIHLNEDLDPEWLNLDDVKVNSTTFFDQGFQEAAAYEIHEMPDFRLKTYIKGPLVAVVYWHQHVGSWVDIVVLNRSDKEYTITNAPMGEGTEQRPECEKIYAKTLNALQLIEKATELAKDGAEQYNIVDATNFRAFFESQYRKETIWKNSKGGLNFQEFINIAQENDESYDDEHLQRGFIETKEQELYRWEAAAMEEYQKIHNITDDEFYEQEESLLIVPFTSDAHAYINYLEQKCLIKEAQVEKLKEMHKQETDMQKLFAYINDLLSPDLRAMHIKDAEFPLKLSIYKLNDAMLD